MTIFDDNFCWQYLMTIFDDNFWWQFLEDNFWCSFLLTICYANFWWQFLLAIFDVNFWWHFFDVNFQIFGKFQIFWENFVAWHLRHWLHCIQLRTTILTITLWPLNKEWWGQHLQFLRCFSLGLPLSYRRQKIDLGLEMVMGADPETQSYLTGINLNPASVSLVFSKKKVRKTQHNSVSSWHCLVRKTQHNSVSSWHCLTKISLFREDQMFNFWVWTTASELAGWQHKYIWSKKCRRTATALSHLCYGSCTRDSMVGQKHNKLTYM